MALEAIAVQAYCRGSLSSEELRWLLGYPTRMQLLEHDKRVIDELPDPFGLDYHSLMPRLR